jgi:hypothetical protein
MSTSQTGLLSSLRCAAPVEYCNVDISLFNNIRSVVLLNPQLMSTLESSLALIRLS